jgi:hypothetical protein
MDVDTVQINDVETINITSLNDYNKMILSADTATSLNITGSAVIELTLDAAKVTHVDATTLEESAALTMTANGATEGTTIEAGSGWDTLTAAGENDVLKGYDGNDTFTAGDLTDIYGGDGADIFNFNTVSNYTKASTVHDAGSGDVFALTYYNTGDSSDNNPVRKFYAAGAQYNENTTTDILGKVNASLVQTGEGEATWFNHNGNTYIVVDGDDASDIAAGAEDIFVQGVDNVIELIGTYDLSTDASFNATNGTLEIA